MAHYLRQELIIISRYSLIFVQTEGNYNQHLTEAIKHEEFLLYQKIIIYLKKINITIPAKAVL